MNGVRALCATLGITSVNVIAYDATKALKGAEEIEAEKVNRFLLLTLTLLLKSVPHDEKDENVRRGC